MHKAQVLEILHKKIKILTENQNKIKNKEWEDLKPDFKKCFDDNVNEFNIIFKLKEFIENDIETEKQEIENPNIDYRLLMTKFKTYENLLKEVGLLETDDTLENIVESWNNKK